MEGDALLALGRGGLYDPVVCFRLELGSGSAEGVAAYSATLFRVGRLHETPISFVAFCSNTHEIFWSTLKLVKQFFKN
jgi:hypothetical protein